MSGSMAVVLSFEVTCPPLSEVAFASLAAAPSEVPAGTASTFFDGVPRALLKASAARIA